MKLEHALIGQPLSNRLGGRLLVPRGAIEPSRTIQTMNNTSFFSSASANAEGSYVDMFAPLTRDAYGLLVSITNNNATRDSQVDIAVGGAGSEVVVIADLLLSHIPAGNASVSMMLPLFIKAGSTVRMRHQSSSGSTSIAVCASGLSGNLFNRLYRKCETWGAVSGDSGGTSVDPGGSANTKGAYSQLIASTAKRVQALCIAIGNQNNNTRTQYIWNVDIAVGGAGSEVVIIPDLLIYAHATNDFMTPPFFGPIPVDIPAGSRVAVRAACTGTDAIDRLFDAVVYGFSEDV